MVLALPVLVLPLLAGGCVSSTAPAPTASSGSAGLVPIAFESISGVPQPVFDRLVASIAQESEARRVLIVSRNDNAEYRIRGYLSAHGEGADGRVAWVFDVFDTNRRRTVRLSGEEPASGGAAWSGTSDTVVAGIAARSMADLSQWLASGGGGPAATQLASQPQASPDGGGDDTPDVAALGAGHGASSFAPN
jgi:hypothetical protein